jgi:L-amino acid N-acyltransferase YncA
MLVIGQGVAEWVFQRVGGSVSAHSQGIGWQVDGELVAGVAYECFTGGNIFVHQCVEGKVPRKFWWAVTDYPFNQLGCKRITGLVDSSNSKALELNKHIGFRVEATLEKAGKHDSDLVVMVLWKEDCRFLRWVKHE